MVNILTLACTYQGFIGNGRGTFSQFPGKYFYMAENSECSVALMPLFYYYHQKLGWTL